MFAVVAGASTGIGAATALALARSGIPVVAAARSMSPLNALESVAEHRANLHPIVADMTDPTDIDRVFADAEGRGPIRMVIHSVGYRYDVGWFVDTDPLSILGATASFVSSPALVLNRVVRSMESTGGGVIGMVSSGAAHKPTPGRALYGPAKAAVDRLVVSVAEECAARGGDVGVFGISPGRVDTPAQRRLIDSAEHAHAAFQLDGFRSTTGVADAAEVGEAIAALASRKPAELNGGIFGYGPNGWVREP